MDFIPYKKNEALQNVFIQIPVELFDKELYGNLNSDSILLYGLLLSRLSLSLKNDWADKDGNIYLVFSRKEAQKMLNLSDKTITKAFKKLEEAKLIYEIRSGFRKSNIIYVGKINHQSTRKNMNRKNSDSRIVKFTTHDTENLRPNYNNNKYNNKNKSVCNYEQRTHSNEEFESLYCNIPKGE